MSSQYSCIEGNVEGQSKGYDEHREDQNDLEQGLHDFQEHHHVYAHHVESGEL